MADLTGLDLFSTALIAAAGAMTGINQAVEHPPEAINDPPMVVAYPTGVRASNPAARTFIYSYNLDIVLGRGDLSHAAEKARKYLGRGLQMLYGATTMGGTCKTISNIAGAFGQMASYGPEFLGVRFTFDVKMQHTDLTVAA